MDGWTDGGGAARREPPSSGVALPTLAQAFGGQVQGPCLRSGSGRGKHGRGGYIRRGETEPWAAVQVEALLGAPS